MPISFTCGNCGKKLRAPDNAAGKSSKCPGCGAKVTCPEPIYEAEAIAPDIPDILDDAPDTPETSTIRRPATASADPLTPTASTTRRQPSRNAAAPARCAAR